MSIAEVRSHWEELSALIELTAVDVAKSCGGNAAAGARVRRSLRDVRRRTTELLKVMIDDSRSAAIEKETARVRASQQAQQGA